MRTIKRLFLGVVLLCGVGSPAEAQDWDGRGYFNLNFGGQSREQTFADAATFTIYGEQGAVAAGHAIGGGTLFDFSAGARVWRNLAVGIAYSSVKNKNDAIVSVRVPHPILFRQFREATATAAALEHSENVVHLQLVWMLPITSRIQIAVMGGPSFFTVRQDVAGIGNPLQDIADAAPFTSVSIRSVTVTDVKDSPVGANIGADLTYLAATVRGVGIGVGGFVRYSGASLDLPAPANGTRDGDLKVGGGQAGAGLRIRF
jgi:hypothetical protein